MLVTDFGPEAVQSLPQPASTLARTGGAEAPLSAAPETGRNETRAEAAAAVAGEAGPEEAGMEEIGTEEGDGAPRALADLIAAGLVTHEMICDPVRVGAEAPALGRLCALVSGAIYRIGPFHYAFRAEAGDMEGALGLLPFDDWGGVLEAALRAELGPEAVWLYATDLLSDALSLDTAETGGAAEAGTGPRVPLAPVALLRPRAAAFEAALEAAPEGMRAVIDAAQLSETARLTAERIDAAVRAATGPALVAALRAELVETARAAAVEAAVGAAVEAAVEAATRAARGATETVLAAATEAAETAVTDAAREAGAEGAAAGEIALRLAGLEARIETQLAALAASAAPAGETGAGLGARLGAIETALAGLVARLDREETRHDLLGEHLAEHLTLRLGAAAEARASESAGRGAAFEETLGLALAEFLARMERTLTEPRPQTRPC